MLLQSTLPLLFLAASVSAIPAAKGACTLLCPPGQICVTDPSRPKQSFCVEPVICGGLVARSCKKGEKCVDDPRDDCDVKEGGADCSGVCIPDVLGGY
ncbi:hypothetical protein BR93DRAFT_922315 [Coniochaeta sp. PMI_546]|nr:hypothetical protein BR93DRAFT_922315 [Coniochaeta sp. PMI_546]